MQPNQVFTTTIGPVKFCLFQTQFGQQYFQRCLIWNTLSRLDAWKKPYEDGLNKETYFFRKSVPVVGLFTVLGLILHLEKFSWTDKQCLGCWSKQAQNGKERSSWNGGPCGESGGGDGGGSVIIFFDGIWRIFFVFYCLFNYQQLYDVQSYKNLELKFWLFILIFRETFWFEYKIPVQDYHSEDQACIAAGI